MCLCPRDRHIKQPALFFEPVGSAERYEAGVAVGHEHHAPLAPFRAEDGCDLDGVDRLCPGRHCPASSPICSRKARSVPFSRA